MLLMKGDKKAVASLKLPKELVDACGGWNATLDLDLDLDLDFNACGGWNETLAAVFDAIDKVIKPYLRP